MIKCRFRVPVARQPALPWQQFCAPLVGGVFLMLASKYHGLYGSISCCISHGPSQWESAIFDQHSSETPGPIFMELEIYNYFPDATRHAQFQGPTSTWVVWANRQFDA